MSWQSEPRSTFRSPCTSGCGTEPSNLEPLFGRLIVQAIEHSYGEPKKGKLVAGPMIPKGRRGPAYPKDENPHDLVFS
jgi:hypothetical protein